MKSFLRFITLFTLFGSLAHAASEKRNVAAQHPDVLARIVEAVNAHKAPVVPGSPQLQ